MIYDSNEKGIDDKKLLKKSSSIILKSSVEKLIEKLINDFIIESNIVLKVKDLYKKNNIFQRIIYIKQIKQRRISYDLIKDDLRLKFENC